MARTGRPRSVVLPMDEIRDLAGQGWTLAQLGEKFHCSRDCMMDRMKEAGIPRLPQWSQPGEKNGQWKGGVQIDADGYILIYSPSHPNKTAAGYVREHRLVMECVLSRYLTEDEVVHHIDGDKANNSPSNLEVFSSNALHLKHELTGQTPNYSEEGLHQMMLNGLQHSRNLRFSSLHKSKTDGLLLKQSTGQNQG